MLITDQQDQERQRFAEHRIDQPHSQILRKRDDEGADHGAAQAIKPANQGRGKSRKPDGHARGAEKRTSAVEHTGQRRRQYRDDPGKRQHEIDVHAALAGKQRIFRRATKLHAEPREGEKEV